jgi:hypothetical protein
MVFITIQGKKSGEFRTLHDNSLRNTLATLYSIIWFMHYEMKMEIFNITLITIEGMFFWVTHGDDLWQSDDQGLNPEIFKHCIEQLGMVLDPTTMTIKSKLSDCRYIGLQPIQLAGRWYPSPEWGRVLACIRCSKRKFKNEPEAYVAKLDSLYVYSIFNYTLAKTIGEFRDFIGEELTRNNVQWTKKVRVHSIWQAVAQHCPEFEGESLDEWATFVALMKDKFEEEDCRTREWAFNPEQDSDEKILRLRKMYSECFEQPDLQGRRKKKTSRSFMREREGIAYQLMFQTNLLDKVITGEVDQGEIYKPPPHTEMHLHSRDRSLLQSIRAEQGYGKRRGQKLDQVQPDVGTERVLTTDKRKEEETDEQAELRMIQEAIAQIEVTKHSDA